MPWMPRLWCYQGSPRSPEECWRSQRFSGFLCLWGALESWEVSVNLGDRGAPCDFGGVLRIPVTLGPLELPGLLRVTVTPLRLGVLEMAEVAGLSLWLWGLPRGARGARRPRPKQGPRCARGGDSRDGRAPPRLPCSQQPMGRRREERSRPPRF